MCRTEEGLDALKADLKDKITLLSGHSGVGKSTIINKLVPGVNLRTGDISEYHNKGMHTTTFSEDDSSSRRRLFDRYSGY